LGTLCVLRHGKFEGVVLLLVCGQTALRLAWLLVGRGGLTPANLPLEWTR